MINFKKKFLVAVVLSLTLLSSSSLMAKGNVGITLDQAMVIVKAAKAQALKQGTLMNIAVVDAGANLTAFIRMDGAFIGSIDISIKKAKTARLFNMPTGKLGELAQPGKPLYNIEFSNNGLITFPGGVPLKDKEGNIIGAIGVSGSSVENDHEVAMAGAAALK
ncbi:MAG TPA: glycolate utilization protein [Sulfurospirillum sp. UBA12182]|nr:MAG TPA: glycolate utilization protein [Sulfurospirillum sp. UBA12182]